MLSAIFRTARFFRNPRIATIWFSEFIEDRISTPRHRKHLNYYSDKQIDVAEGVAGILGMNLSTVNNELLNLPSFLTKDNKNAGISIRWSAASEFAATTYALVKLLKPDIVVETGVGAGVSSWTILQAMEENAKGRLISIDLPTPNTELLPEVGYLVPTPLRSRWDLREGSSHKLLTQTLQEVGEIDIFQHDSRHSYVNQLREYKTAWPFIKQNGLLVSDDISNDALHDACQVWNLEPFIIRQGKDAPIGLVRKT